jgi:hypothetical protein
MRESGQSVCSNPRRQAFRDDHSDIVSRTQQQLESPIFYWSYSPSNSRKRNGGAYLGQPSTRVTLLCQLSTTFSGNPSASPSGSVSLSGSGFGFFLLVVKNSCGEPQVIRQGSSCGEPQVIGRGARIAKHASCFALPIGSKYPFGEVLCVSELDSIYIYLSTQIFCLLWLGLACIAFSRSAYRSRRNSVTMVCHAAPYDVLPELGGLHRGAFLV